MLKPREQRAAEHAKGAERGSLKRKALRANGFVFKDGRDETPGGAMIGWKGGGQGGQVASYRFRVEGPVRALSARGHAVEVFDPARADEYDTIVFCKSYSAKDVELAQAITARGGRVVFDVNDNHFYNPYGLPRYVRARDELLAMMGVAERVICSTPALAEVVATETQGAVRAHVVGDAAERLKAPPINERVSDEPLRLLWFGSHGSPNAPSGMADLQLIRERLERLQRSTALELVICSNNAQKFQESIAPFDLPTRYVEWSQASFGVELASAHGVLIPITLNPFTACKTHNRLTTALYAGRPAVATAIESYQEFGPFCVLDDFEEGLDALASDLTGMARRAEASRPYIDEHWSPEALAPRWEAALGLPAGAAPPAKRRARPGRPGRAAVYQGRLDAIAAGAVTGWVHDLQSPGRALEVVLESDGEVVASAVADLPRDDLRGLGLPQPACGFALSLRDVAVADPAGLRVKVNETGWLVGEHPIIMPDGDEFVSDFPVDVSTKATVSPREESRITRMPGVRAREVQAHLLSEVQGVEQMLFEVRSALARSVIALGSSAPAAERLARALDTLDTRRVKEPEASPKPRRVKAPRRPGE